MNKSFYAFFAPHSLAHSVCVCTWIGVSLLVSDAKICFVMPKNSWPTQPNKQCTENDLKTDLLPLDHKKNDKLFHICLNILICFVFEIIFFSRRHFVIYFFFFALSLLISPSLYLHHLFFSCSFFVCHSCNWIKPQSYMFCELFFGNSVNGISLLAFQIETKHRICMCCRLPQTTDEKTTLSRKIGIIHCEKLTCEMHFLHFIH